MTHPCARALIWALGLSGLISSSAAAQVGETRLTQPDATYPEALNYVSGIRELPDGKLLVSDGLGQELLLMDIEQGTAEVVGRNGAGPEEYRNPDLLFPMAGDSTLLVDLGNGRLTVLGPDLQFGETMPIGQDGGGGQLSIVLPRGVDFQGRIYFQGRGPRRMGQGALPDSAVVLRWDRATGTIDTLVSVKLQERTRSVSGGGNNRNVSIQTLPLTPQDAWGVGFNGRLAVARSGDYHLEWIDPDGTVVAGEPVEYKPVRVGGAEKERWIQNVGRSGLGMSISVNNGVRQMAFSRGGRGAQDQVDQYQWPEVMPAFSTPSVEVTPWGNAWVERSVPAGAEPVFDVFGSDGSHQGRVILPAGRQVVGFGEGAVYTVTFDEFDLQWLERYPIH